MFSHFNPPLGDQSVQRERAQVLTYSVCLITAGCVVGGLFGWWQNPAAMNWRLAPLAYTAPILALTCLEVNRRKFSRVAAWLFLAVFIALTCLRIRSLGGISSPTAGLLPVMTLFAGVTLSASVGVATAAACAALGLEMMLQAQQGVIAPFSMPPLTAWVSLCVCIVCTLFLALIAVDRTAKALRATRGELASRQAAERRLALALASGAVGTYEADLDGDWLIVDDSTLKIFGLRRRPGHHPTREAFRALIHPDDLPKLVEAYESLKQGAANYRVELRWRHADGDRYIEVAASAFTEASGARVQVGTVTDLTERRRAENERQNLELQLRSAEQTRAIGSMARGIAHDFNNLLGAIQGFSRLLEEDLPPGSADHRFAARITDATERGKAVVDQILSFARREADKRATINLNDLVAELRPLLESLIAPGVSLAVEPGPNNLWCDINNGLFTQALSNLCRNASDAIGDRAGTVTIQLQRLTAALRAEFLREVRQGKAQMTGVLGQEIDYVVIRVCDDGPGISREGLDHLFEPFYTTKAFDRGTGLGLTVVRSAAENHDGVCVVQSEPGRGSRFSVIMPLAMRPPSPPKARTCAKVTGSGRVLVVDDEADITDVLVAGLARRGFEAVAFNDPNDALAALTKNAASWRMMITDQFMPEMRGADLARAAKALRPDLPVVLYSGFDDESRASIDESGDVFDLRLCKPMGIEEMVQRFTELMA